MTISEKISRDGYSEGWHLVSLGGHVKKLNTTFKIDSLSLQ